VLDSSYELAAFAAALGAEFATVMVGDPAAPPALPGTCYLADAAQVGEYNPALHRDLVLEAVRREDPNYVVLSHSSYGWDLAPRLSFALPAAQISEIVALGADGAFQVPVFNAKLRLTLRPKTRPAVLTVQAGAFSPEDAPRGQAQVVPLTAPAGAPAGSDVAAAHDGEGATGAARLEFLGYEEAERHGVDLGKAAVIVSAGRGVGKKENIEQVAALARALGGELGSSRPLVDAGWLDPGQQVGSTGQTVAPKLYVACGISGAIQHLAGMRRSSYIVAINKDREAPIGEVADVLAVGDLNELLPLVLQKLEG
jgi:electron transfer flavoprotein alpha subunit